MKWMIQIVRYDGDEVVHSTGPVSDQMLERTMLGIMTNMDQERFYLREVEVE